ncbi:MAG: hypothetical protein ACXVHX_22725 [Solirubrobacteraceae bacterium]
MKLWMLVLALAVASPAVASAPLTMKKARTVARHVRHLDAVNNFDVQVDMGGKVTFGAISCSRRTPREVACGYNVTRVTPTDARGRLRCRVDVDVTLRAGRTSWGRHFGACSWAT